MSGSDPTTGQTRPSEDVAILDHSLWSSLEKSEDLEEYGAAWLALLCQRISGASRAVLILRSQEHQQMEPVAYWPKGRSATKGLSAAAETALRENRGVARTPKSSEEQTREDLKICDMAQPIRVGDEVVGLVAVEISMRSTGALAGVMRDLQWGAAWITAYFQIREAKRNKASASRLKLAVELFAATLEQRHFQDACRSFATELATEMDCDRVSIGVRKRRTTRILAISHSANFDRRMKIIRAIGSAVDEAIDQWCTLIHPVEQDTGTILRAHAELSRQNKGLAILTSPLPAGEKAMGGVCLEREVDKPFTEEEAAFVETLAALIGPVLEEKRRNDRSFFSKFIEAVWAQIARLLGPNYLGRKLGLAAVIALVSFMSIATGNYRITSDARLAGMVQRAIAVPFDGYLQSATVRAGDTVSASDIVAALDTKDLEIERLRRMSERNRALVEYDQALAESDRSGLNIIKARISQAEAQIDLLDAQIERAALVAPYDGLVVTGDLSQRIGDAVNRGEILFEIAPLNSYRVEIEVDERDIDEIQIGQIGQLALSAFPEDVLHIDVLHITPVSSQREGLNFFQVEAGIVDETIRGRLRPGMEGVVKIEVDKRRLIWIWTHRMTDWTRLAYWRWRP